jgi:hypothetical protein
MLLKRTHIIIHHSAGPDSIARDWDSIRADHLHRCWRDIGYNFGIEFVGKTVGTFSGRALNIPGAHCKQGNMNKKAIGICVVGNFQIAPPHPLLISSLAFLCIDLCCKHGIPAEHIEPHRNYKNTLCPGKYFPVEYLRNLVNLKVAKGN